MYYILYFCVFSYPYAVGLFTAVYDGRPRLETCLGCIPLARDRPKQTHMTPCII